MLAEGRKPSGFDIATRISTLEPPSSWPPEYIESPLPMTRHQTNIERYPFESKNARGDGIGGIPCGITRELTQC